jgi:hypothetical protein
MPKLQGPELATLLERRYDVGRRYISGSSQLDIARDKGISQSVVSKDIAWCKQKWREELAERWDEKIAVELQKIDNVERLALDAFERSQKDTVTFSKEVERALRKKKVDKPAPAPVPAKGKGKTATPPVTVEPESESEMVPVNQMSKRQRRSTAGDPRWLERVSWCIEIRLRMLGALSKDGMTFQLNFNKQDGKSDLISISALSSRPGLVSVPTTIEVSADGTRRVMPVEEDDDVERMLQSIEKEPEPVVEAPQVEETVEQIMQRLAAKNGSNGNGANHD